MASIEGRIAMPPAVSSLLSLPSYRQSVELARDPPTESENEPRAATSLLGPPVKELLGWVSVIVPGVSVANWTKSRPFKGSSATCWEVIPWPSVGLVVSTRSEEHTSELQSLRH